MILMIDNYDSFTFNLVQYLSARDEEVKTIRNDALQVDQILALKPSLVVLSPGPGRPEDAGVCVELIRQAPADLSIFGVCLGFQAMVAAYGGTIVHAPYLMHGKTSPIHHNGQGVFADLPQNLAATRYHSLMADPGSLPACFEVSATTQDGLLMGIRHKQKRQEAVQFHPESYLTQHGLKMIQNIVS